MGGRAATRVKYLRRRAGGPSLLRCSDMGRHGRALFVVLPSRGWFLLSLFFFYLLIMFIYFVLVRSSRKALKYDASYFAWLVAWTFVLFYMFYGLPSYAFFSYLSYFLVRTTLSVWVCYARFFFSCFYFGLSVEMSGVRFTSCVCLLVPVSLFACRLWLLYNY